MVKLLLGNRADVNEVGWFTARCVGASVEVIRFLMDEEQTGM